MCDEQKEQTNGTAGITSINDGRVCLCQVFLAWAMAGVVAGRAPQAQASPGVCPTTEAELQSAIANAGNGGTVTLSCATPTTIAFSKPISITRDVALDASSSPAAIIITGDNKTQLFDVRASLTLNSLTLEQGRSEAGAIEIDPTAALSMVHSTFSANSVTETSATAPIFNSGTLTVSDSTLSGNSAGGIGSGGAIYNSGMATVRNSRFSGNRVGGAWETGGAIFNNEGLIVSNSTFYNNSAGGDGGAISNAGRLEIANSTFFNNSAPAEVAINGSLPAGLGGAIYNAYGRLAFTNSDFANNSAGQGGGINNKGGAMTATASIIVDNSGGNCVASDGFATIDKGYNLTGNDGSDCGLSASTDILNADPQLLPLADNGGLTQTMALSPKSPAIDVIPVSSGDCPKTDQRGATRPDAGELFCDIGAYEYMDDPRPIAPTLSWVQPSAITYGTALSRVQLDATAVDTQGHAVFGTFTYNPSAGRFLHAGGGQTLKATFAPTEPWSYLSGGTVSTTIDVTPANLTVTADNQSVAHGLLLPALKWHANFVAGDAPSSLTTQPICSTSATTDANHRVTSPPGKYSITCSGAVDRDYVITDAAGTLTVQPGRMTVTINASRPYGSAPALTNLRPSDPRITYSPASFAAKVTGTLTCVTTATSTSPAGRYPISHCSGLSDPERTIVYDYAHSSYRVTLANVTLTYTGPTSIRREKPVTLSAMLTSKVTGKPISGRVLRMQIGRGHFTQSCVTRKTNANGQGSCVITFVMPYLSPNPLRMWFDGDQRGPNYDYAPGYNWTPVTMVQ